MYPVTIIKDRYRGTYSGGNWTAWNRDFYEVPEEVGGDDVECCNFWYECKEIVGKGDTPAEAYADLIRRTKWDTKTNAENG